MDEKTQNPNESKGWKALRQAGSNFCTNFTEGTSRIADDILDKTTRDKLKKVRDTSWTFLKGLMSGIQKDLKAVRVIDLMGETSYEIGRISAIGKNYALKIWDRAMEKLDEDKTKG